MRIERCPPHVVAEQFSVIFARVTAVVWCGCACHFCLLWGKAKTRRWRERQETPVRCSILQGGEREGWLKILAGKTHPILLQRAEQGLDCKPLGGSLGLMNDQTFSPLAWFENEWGCLQQYWALDYWRYWRRAWMLHIFFKVVKSVSWLLS